MISGVLCVSMNEFNILSLLFSFSITRTEIITLLVSKHAEETAQLGPFILHSAACHGLFLQSLAAFSLRHPQCQIRAVESGALTFERDLFTALSSLKMSS